MAVFLLDTNVVLRFLDTTSPLNPLMRQALTTLRFKGHVPKICPQNIVELWAVATRPLSANGFGWTPEFTQSEVFQLLNLYELLPDNSLIFTEWLELVTTYKVSGKQVHDARLAATAKVHEVENLLTLNVEDFKRFELNAVYPSKLIQE
ncbi:MAG: type II toxin-antitoxin system VapC family toxin [Trueperaceae bacterium]